MQFIWENISGAPWWVYVVFVYLLIIGIWSFRPRTVSIYRFFIVPTVLFLWSIYILYLKMLEGFSWPLIPFWAVVFIIGAFIGSLAVRSWHIRGNRSKRQITFPGNYSTLILLMLVFVVHFVFGSIESTKPPVSDWVHIADILASSLIAGFFSGRALIFMHRYMRGSH